MNLLILLRVRRLSLEIERWPRLFPAVAAELYQTGGALTKHHGGTWNRGQPSRGFPPPKEGALHWLLETRDATIVVPSVRGGQGHGGGREDTGRLSCSAPCGRYRPRKRSLKRPSFFLALTGEALCDVANPGGGYATGCQPCSPRVSQVLDMNGYSRYNERWRRYRAPGLSAAYGWLDYSGTVYSIHFPPTSSATVMAKSVFRGESSEDRKGGDRGRHIAISIGLPRSKVRFNDMC